MLHFIGVDKGFSRPKKVAVLRSIHLAVPAGQAVCISGPVGVGKSTLIRLAAGELFADAGELRVLGHDPSRLRSKSLASLRRLIAWIPQELRLLDQRSALDNVALAAEAVGCSHVEARREATFALAALGLADDIDTPVFALSTGQRRRVSVARGLAAKPRVVLADEPTGDLDGEGVSLLTSAIASRLDDGASALLTTHDRRLIDAGLSRGWAHYRLVAGELEQAQTTTNPAQRTGVVVPFVPRARVGGME